MAAYVKQLLDFDEGTRRATLESLSKYELKDMDKAVTEGLALGKDASAKEAAQSMALNTPLPMKVNSRGDVARAWSRDSKFEPMSVDLPPGLFGPSSSLDAKASMQSNAAEAEADLSLSRVPTPPFACTQETAPSSPSVGAPCQQGHPDDGMVKDRLGTMLEKALGDLTRSLPPGDAMEARKFLASVVGGSAKQGQHLELSKWLTLHLEQQQEVSMQRLAKFMGNTPPGSPGANTAGTGQGATAGTLNKPQPPFSGLGAAGPVPLPGFSARSPAPVLGRPAFQPAVPVGCQQGASTLCAPSVRTGPPTPPQRWCVTPAEPVEGWSGLTDCGMAVPHMGETLRMHLRSLIKIDSGRILIVRKINRLGFASPDILRQHFSWYGEVERVLVAHSRVKSSAPLTQAGNQMASRLRPSGLGFIVMSKPEEAAAILAVGQEQVICGAFIRVQQFERRVSDADEGVEDQGTAGDESPHSPRGE